MLISERHGFAFIHIYKVAGTSIRNALSPYARPGLLQRIARRLGIGRNIPGHLKARDAGEYVDPTTFDALFKFAFVRNPWDWQVSLYEFMRNDPNHHQHELVQSFSSFEHYIDWRVNEDRHLQSEWVTDGDGRVLVDFVGRYERLNEDFEHVCREIGIEASLPHLNASRREGEYRGYYTERARELVAYAFREDIDRFGYEF